MCGWFFIVQTKLLKIENAESFKKAVGAATELLKRGEVVALPTETVYGLAANALDAEAVAKIFEVKGRPSFNPIIVHIANWEQARECVTEWPPAANLVARKFWPGPLTVVLPKSGLIPFNVAAGGDTVGIRWPSHPFMQAVIQACGFPLAAPSANLANQISPTTAEHVLAQLGGKIPLVVDAGPAAVGIESTVLDLSGGTPHVLRPGMISATEIMSLLQIVQAQNAPLAGERLKSPGQLPRHYAPRARVVILKWCNEQDLREQAERFGRPMNEVHIIAHEVIPHDLQFGRVSIVPQDPEAYARALYSELHEADRRGARLILVEATPDDPAWDGIRDRLRRASA